MKKEEVQDKVEETKDNVKDKAKEVKKDAEKNAEKASKKVAEKTEEVKEKAKETADNVKEKAQEISKEAKKKTDEAIHEVKTNKKLQTGLIIAGVVLVIAIIGIILYAYLTGPRAAAKDFANLYYANRAKAVEKYTPNKKFNDEREKLLNSKNDIKIKKINKKKKDKYEVKAEVRSIDTMKFLGEVYKNLSNNDKYINEPKNNSEQKNNQKLELEEIKKQLNDAEFSTNEKEFIIFKDASGKWSVENL